MRVSLLAAAVAGALSLMVHAAGLLGYRTTPNEVAVDGALPVAAAFGNAFADLVSGSTSRPKITNSGAALPQPTSAMPPKVAQPVTESRQANEVNVTAPAEAVRPEALSPSLPLITPSLENFTRAIIPAQPEIPVTPLPDILDNRTSSAAALSTVEVANERNPAKLALSTEVTLLSGPANPKGATIADIEAAPTTKAQLVEKLEAIPADVHDYTSMSAPSAAALSTVEVANERNPAKLALSTEVTLLSGPANPKGATIADIEAAPTTKAQLVEKLEAIPADVHDYTSMSAPKAKVEAWAEPKAPKTLQNTPPGTTMGVRPASQAPVAASELVSTRETASPPQLRTPEQAAPVVATTAPQPDDPVETSKTRPKPKPALAPVRPDTGNANHESKRGQAEARDDGSALASGQGESVASLTQAQTRAASKWEQRVLGKIQRARRKLPRVRALAVVDFQISPNGTIARIKIYRSSGNADFDRLALDHVRRAAPFPPPPAGARTRLGVEVEGRR